MKTITNTIAAVLLGVTSLFAGGEGWLTNMEEAKKKATEEKKDLLIDFTGSDWCGWCIKLNQEVFDHEPFKNGVKDSFVLVELDFPKEKKLPEELTKQNEQLSKSFGVRGFPTIMLCDEKGLPYASTGYQAGGPEKYVAHLNELREIRKKRDTALEAAAAAKDNAMKAGHLVSALKAMDQEMLTNSYSLYKDTIANILKLDPANAYAKELKTTAEKKAAAEEQGKLVQTFFVKTIRPLLQNNEFDKASTELDTFLKENDALDNETKAGLTLNVKLAGIMKNADEAAAHKIVDEVSKNYPDTQVASNADKIKKGISEQIARAKAAQENKEAQPAE